MTDDRLEELASQLDRIAEALAELSMDVLREALDGGVTEADQATTKAKSVNRAQAAVEKAALNLRRLSGEDLSDL